MKKVHQVTGEDRLSLLTLTLTLADAELPQPNAAKTSLQCRSPNATSTRCDLPKT